MIILTVLRLAVIALLYTSRWCIASAEQLSTVYAGRQKKST